jgi:hypothetical protein
MRSAALDHQSEHYPASWHGRVPKRVRMAKMVGSDMPMLISPAMTAHKGQEYEVWVNSHGAVAAILPDGRRLGLRPYEFEVIEWHEGAVHGGT